MRRLILATGSLVATGSCGSHSNNNNPPDFMPQASCISAIPADQLGDVCRLLRKATGPKECPGYEDTTGVEVCDPVYTETFDVSDGSIAGCNGAIHLAWPACSLVGAATGTIGSFQPSVESDDPDGDYSIDLCPLFQEVIPGVIQPMTMDLRTPGNFSSDYGATLGSIHVEVQDCMFWRGSYLDQQTLTLYDASPAIGAYVAAFGEWVADHGHPDYHAEIHEATALAVVKPDQHDPLTELVFASGFFVNRIVQPNQMLLDVMTPVPSGATSMTSCTLAADLLAGQVPHCTDYVEGVIVTPSVIGGEACHLLIQNFPASPTPPPIVDYGCWAQQGGPNGQCSLAAFNPSACDPRIAFAQPFRAVWDPPANLWECTCPAPDPSTAGATINVPIQGCSAATDVITGCTDVCSQQGQACDSLAEPGCYLGDTKAPSHFSGQIVGPESCDPSQPSLHTHVSQSGDYRADVAGHVTVTTDDGSTTQPLTASVWFDLASESGVLQVIDIADVVGTVPDFCLDTGLGNCTHINNVQVFIGTRQVGLFDDPTHASHFRVPAGLGVYGIRADVDGKLQGLNITNATGFDMSGYADLNGGTFTLHVSGTDPKSGGTIVADATGSITNLPPHADASRTTARVECSSHTATPITLDGTASRDPDGDPIAHYQWFRLDHGVPESFGTGNVAIAHASLTVNTSATFALHVYDPQLGANETTTTVTVVDTTPPIVSVSPRQFELWPPNNKMNCYLLGEQVNATATDTCDPDPIVRIASVTSNEPTGGGQTPDVTWTDTQFCVRGERSGSAGPRVYTVAIEAVDQSGNATVENVTVTVPHDQSVR